MMNALAETTDLNHNRPGNGKAPMKFTFAPESKPLDGFTIKRAIQRGAFGEVYYALSDAGKEVALKLVQQNMDVELRGVSQCLNLKHPNLVTIFDLKTDSDGDHWVVMEYVAGRSLDQHLRDYPNGAPIEKTKEWMTGIAAGIAYLHDRGIVHRDLKPANIYCENDLIKIGDVGLSKYISPSRRSAHTQSVGTVYYMAPEIAHGRYGREVDVYSLAIMLYEMLTGHVPFEGETTGEILMKHLSVKPDLDPIPEALRPVLARALEKDPQQRTSNVPQLEREFHQAVSGQPIPKEIPAAAFVSRDVNQAAKQPGTDGWRKGKSCFKGKHASWAKHSKPKCLRDVAGNLKQKVGDIPVNYQTPEWWKNKDNLPRRIGGWLRTAAPFLIVAAIFIPGLFFGLLRAVFVSGIFGALAYGTFRIAQSGVNYIASLFSNKSTVAANANGFLNAAGNAGAVATGHNETATPELASKPSNVDVPPPTPKVVPPPVVRPVSRTVGLSTPINRQISLRTRVTELSGSMVLAVFCTLIITAGLLAAGILTSATAAGVFGLTALIGSWAVMAPTKIWEGTTVDPFVKRLTLLGLGVVVGACGFWLDQVLMFNFVGDQASYQGAFHSFGPHMLVDAARQPTLMAYVLFFGCLFFLRSWWRHTDSFRMRRLRVSSLALTALLGYVISQVWSFPVEWAMTWAITVSSIVQISSVWIPQDERSKYLGGQTHA